MGRTVDSFRGNYIVTSAGITKEEARNFLNELKKNNSIKFRNLEIPLKNIIGIKKVSKIVHAHHKTFIKEIGFDRFECFESGSLKFKGHTSSDSSFSCLIQHLDNPEYLLIFKKYD